MKSNFLSSTILSLVLLPASAIAQEQAPQTPSMQASPAAAISGSAGGAYSGYVPSANAPGLYVGTVGDGEKTAASDAKNVQPALTDNTDMSKQRVDGFNKSIEKNFPMTPEMIQKYREIYDANQKALYDRPEPKGRVDAGFISLQPGETPPQLTVSPGIASVIGFYDVTGQPWPIDQYILGDGKNFQVVQVGKDASSIAVTPLRNFGWTNIIVALKDEAKPVVMNVKVSDAQVQYRHDVQIMSSGPNAKPNMANTDSTVEEAGSPMLLNVLSGVDLPKTAKPVRVEGVDARAWLIGEKLYIRSKSPMLSPSWLASMSGPDNVRVYMIDSGPVALFSVNGTIVRADIDLP